MKTIKKFLEENTFFFDYDNYFLHILDKIIEFPTAIKNAIILYLMRRTRLYTTVLYEVTRHTCPEEMEVYFKQRKKQKELDKINS